MDTLNFTQLRALLHQRCGLHFTREQEADLLLGIQGAMRTAGYDDPRGYYLSLSNLPISDPLWKNLISLVTVGETYFFRNTAHFKALRENIFPRIIARRRHYGLKNLRIWSAGCASGEEPYSIAILLHELLPDIAEWHITILGTDINEVGLEKAQRGQYGGWSFRQETPLDIQTRYFIPIGSDRYVIAPIIQQMVEFRYLNLVDNVYPNLNTNSVHMDIILCRNVTIYFDRETTRQVIGRFSGALVEGGWLFVGHAEPMAGMYTDYEVHNFPNAVIYRKPIVSTIRPPTGPLLLPHPSGEIQAPTPVYTDTNLYNDINLNSQHHKQHGDQLLMAQELIAQQAHDPARQILLKLLDQAPQHVEALFLLAKLAADEGQFEWVHELLNNIDSVNPLVAQSHYLRALIYQQQQDFNEAKNSLRRALYANRDFALAHYVMGELLYTEGKATLAQRSWQNALNVLTKNPADAPVPFGDGLLVGTLCHAIQQRLNKL